jgi:hypothetical protein
VIWQRPNDKSVYQTQHRGASADAKRERQDRNGRESGRFYELAERVTKIIYHRVLPFGS